MDNFNFTSNYLSLLKKEGKIDRICDGESSLEIPTIKFSENTLPIEYSSPKIIYDKLDFEEEDLVEPDIKVFREGFSQFLIDAGIKLISFKPKIKWKKRQSKEYKLVNDEKIDGKSIEDLPSNHLIEWDRANQRCRIIGANCKTDDGIIGETDWLWMGERKKKRRYNPDYEMLDYKRILLENDKEKRYGKNIIKDIPIMIGFNGVIVCVPHRKEPNNICIVGKKGTGKSLLLNRIHSEIFSLWRENIIIMNDIQEECLIWNDSLQNPLWINQLKRINEKPLASPIIYVYPHTNTLNLNIKKNENLNFIQITIPFEEIIEKMDIYLDLGKSERYIRGIKEKLIECETTDDVKKIIEEEFSGDPFAFMREKMIVSFEDIFNEEITNMKKEFPYKLATEKYNDNPFIILSKIGLIPCFETNDLFTKRYMDRVIAYHLNSIFNSKFDGLLENETVHIIFDELTQICSDENKNSAYESLCTIATRGRKNKLGLLYATQNYTKIPRKIKSNTDYLFAFRHSNAEDVREIKKDFNLNKLDEKEILSLNDFEIVGITNEYFVCYYKNKRWIPKEKVIKGKLIPPQSNHLEIR